MFPNIKIKKVKSLFVFVFAIILILAVFSQVSAKPTSDVGFGSGKNLPPTRPQRLSVAMAGVATYHLQPSDWLYYKSNGDFSAYLGKKSSTLPNVRYQKDNNYLQFSLNNVSSTTSASLETNTKTPNTPTLFYRNAFSDTDVTYQITNIPFKVKEEIVLKNPPAAPERSYGGRGSENLNFVFSAETTGKPVKQKDGSIAFFGDNGEYLFQLDKPFMVDARGIISDEVSVEIIPLASLSSEKLSSYQVKNNSQFSISNFQSIFNDPIFKPISSLFSSLKIENYKFNRNSKLEIENSKPRSYQIILSANSEWLKTATYPVIIDPTVTHNADSNFTGQMNRIADSDTTSSTQLESSYPEASKDPYTVLLLHFNEANGTTVGITDMASSTRVITANGNASTTSYVTQLGMNNSLAVDGVGDYLSAPDSDDWNFGSGDFSIDFWVNFNALPGTNILSNIVGQYAASNYWYFGFNDSSGIKSWQLINVVGGTTNIDYSRTPVIGVGVWHYIALIRAGTIFKIFQDGLQVGADISDPDTMVNSTGSLVLGGINSGSYLNGNLDEFRVIKGRALTSEEIKAAASRRPYAVYISPVIDAAASVAWNTVNWTEGGVNTGDGETLYNTSGLIAQWNFNETSGTTATSSTNGSCVTCAGTLTNFASTASQDQTAGTGWTANNKKWGAGALMMSGVATADLVSIADPASNVLDPNSADLTLETWIKTSDTSAEIFSNNNANGTACTNNGYYLGIDASGYPVFYLDTNGATAGCDAQISSNITAKINDSKWHHLVVSVTRGTSAIMYLDGIQIGSDTSVTSYASITVAGAVYFGGSAGGLDAILDSTRIYSRALSASEILSNYNAGNIEIQTRTGATSDPNDGSWEAWKPTTGETQLLNMNSDAGNWHSDIMASTTIATSTETVIKAEGTGSLKIRTGMASTTAGTVALWHFEETGTTTGTTLYDETANNNDATTTGTTVVDGIFGKARKFNGTSDYVNALALTGGTAVQSVDFWVYPLTTTEYFVDLNGSAYVWANAGTVTATGFTSPTIYVNGAVSSVIVAGQWQHIAVTTGTGINASAPKIGKTTTNFLEGTMDEVRVLNRALSPDEIAETYRMGANHHLTRQVSAVDLSAQTKLAFWIAADRPGTGLEAMLGESDYANYELASSTAALSTNTVLYIKGDEIANSTSIKDSSFSGKTITANGNAKIAGGGKIGNAVAFDGTGDYLTIPTSSDTSFSGDFTIEGWVNFNTTASRNGIFAGEDAGYKSLFQFELANSSSVLLQIANAAGTGWDLNQSFIVPTVITGSWYHFAITRTGSTVNIRWNGNTIGSATSSVTPYNAGNLYIGATYSASFPLNGYLDEIRIIKGAALTPDQIRQAYEYGLRTHPITIDFGATLQSSDLISSATDYNFSITATTSGLSATTSGLYLGDKIIIKENLGGTEYTAQGTVNAINTTTGAITVPSWDSGSTFPASNGYSPNATVFKWQREYFDITGAATTTRDAITNLTIRPTNGAEGRTIYLDDFRYNTNYLTASSSSAITSGNNRYLQYRTIFSSTDTFVSPFLTAFNTLYTSLATMFPSLIGVSGGGFLSF